MDTPYIVARRPEDLLPFLPALKGAAVIAVDSETTGLDAKMQRMRLLQLAFDNYPVIIIDCFSFLPDGFSVLKEILEGSSLKVMQNAKFDLSFLLHLGIKPSPVFDTMLAAQLLRSCGGPARANLPALVLHYLNEELDKTEQVSNWQGELSSKQLAYAAKDADILLRLHRAIDQDLQRNDLVSIAAIEFGCVSAVTDMEYHGVSLDTSGWRLLTAKTEQERDAALKILHEFSGEPDAQTSLLGAAEVVLDHNFDSNTYVQQLLQSQGINVDSTSRRDLYSYNEHPLVQALLAYRKAAKALSAFLYPFVGLIHPVSGRIHPDYRQIGASSGRMSCGDPNIQQIPRDAAFRACFVAPTGRKLVIADYSQIELRVAAEISRDNRMINAYKNNEDLHRLTASLVSGIPAGDVTTQQRQAAKAVNFGLIYGMGAAGLQTYAQTSYGVEMSLEQARAFRERFFRAYPGIASWHRLQQQEKPAQGKTLAGRRFVFELDTGLSMLCNTPVQGTAADILKLALGILAKRLHGSSTYIIAAVHDEILLETDASNAEDVAVLLKDAMEEAGNTILSSVPCLAEAAVADNWAGK